MTPAPATYETAGARRLAERKVARRAGLPRVAGGMREGEALERRVLRTWESDSADTEGRLCLVCQAVEQSLDAAACALEALSSLVECECAWCGEWWPASDVHDVSEIFSSLVILVCPVCDPN